MARSRSGRNIVNRSRRDISISIANRRLPTPRLYQIEDRRTFHPSRIRPVMSFNSNTYRLIEAQRRRVRQSLKTFRPATYTQTHIAFEAPRRVLICVRRRVRKEVMHALRKAGRGGQRRPRRNEYSDVRC